MGVWWRGHWSGRVGFSQESVLVREGKGACGRSISVLGCGKRILETRMNEKEVGRVQTERSHWVTKLLKLRS